MRLPKTAHTSRPWRVHELTSDFSVEDVWSFRTPGAGPDDFPAMLAAMRAAGRPVQQPWPVRFLFAVRWKLDMESAREPANKTVHTVMHLGWVQGTNGDHELRMAVLVKPNGWFGRLYMAAIAPFRHLIVYPALTRQWERAWRERRSR
ncbi:DUF2867 domain-containing protein [Nonomuraea sp. H19]|uniref:DUF2867 domain-containing protein n=1 Tax=Nonomuraea sp. H19 TaxID=3452206 RepID=UPI003F88BBF8